MKLIIEDRAGVRRVVLRDHHPGRIEATYERLTVDRKWLFLRRTEMTVSWDLAVHLADQIVNANTGELR